MPTSAGTSRQFPVSNSVFSGRPFTQEVTVLVREGVPRQATHAAGGNRWRDGVEGRLRKALTRVELTNKDANGQHMSSLGVFRQKSGRGDSNSRRSAWEANSSYAYSFHDKRLRRQSALGNQLGASWSRAHAFVSRCAMDGGAKRCDRIFSAAIAGKSRFPTETVAMPWAS